MNRVLVIGCPGAGKSTFARALRDKTGLPLFYLDQIWHRPDRTNLSREEFGERVGEILRGDRWIIDGNYLGTLEARLGACDTVFFLDYPLECCLRGAKARVGTRREDLPWVETELDKDFLQWILDFPRDQRPRILELLAARPPEVTVRVFRERSQGDAYLSGLFPPAANSNSAVSDPSEAPDRPEVPDRPEASDYPARPPAEH